MTQQELDIIIGKVGKEAGDKITALFSNYDQKAIEFANTAAKGKISEETFNTFKKTSDETIEKLNTILEKQGTTLTELGLQVEQAKASQYKSIAQTLYEDKEALREIFDNRQTYKAYMLTVNEKGETVMKPHSASASKTVGPVASISGINGGTAASIFQTIDAASLLRLGGDSAIISQYRNTTWLFDLVNVINAGWDNMMAMWFEEVAKTGASATVAEGGAKPLVQYAYSLKTATYKKEAMLIGFTEEWNLDFQRLQADILGKGRTDVMNRINTVLLTDLLAAATAYNTGTAYKNGAILTQYNDYIALDAAAAQVENATFGAKANAAIMSTFKYHRVNTQMDTQGRFLMPPASLNGITQLGNPAMATDDLIVGDLKQFNLILRGGLIVRIGYNGTDFAQNMFSTVIEQYYYDYISAIRAVAIVKGQTFTAIKTAVTS